MKHILVVKPNTVDGEIVKDRISANLGISANDFSITYMSNISDRLYLTREPDVIHSVFATGDCKFDHGYIVSEYPLLYANSFTLEWIGIILNEYLKNASLWIEIPNIERNKKMGRVTPDLIEATFTNIDVERKDKIVKINQIDNDVESRVSSMYSCTYDKYDEFHELYANNIFDKADPRRISPELSGKTFQYSMFGANQKSFVMQNILSKTFDRKDLVGLDVGGGFGFLALEMVKLGCHMTVTDYDPARTEVIGPWLSRVCEIEDKIRFITASMEDIVAIDGSYDFISFFGSFLYAERGSASNILSACIEKLNPGGILIVHENPKERASPDALDYNVQFEAKELHDLLSKCGEPKYYSMFNACEIEFEQAVKSVMMVVISK